MLLVIKLTLGGKYSSLGLDCMRPRVNKVLQDKSMLPSIDAMQKAISINFLLSGCIR